jgi:hypothetical protein
MKLKVNGKEYTVSEPTRKEKLQIATEHSGIFNLKKGYFDAEATAKVNALIERILIKDENHPVYDQAPAAVVDDLREMARLVSEGLTGEEQPD